MLFIVEILIAVLVICGSLIALLGSLGLIKLKTYFERVHSPTIIATFGTWLIMWACLIFFSIIEKTLSLHFLLMALFIAVTNPITTVFAMRATLFRERRTNENNKKNIPLSISNNLEE